MGVSKSLNRLAILGLLACGAAWAQDTVSVQVGLSMPGPIFMIDGQVYSSPQVVQWTVGSTHQVYFLQSQEGNGTLGTHQYPPSAGTRYTFGGWVLSGQALLGDQGPLLNITVESTLTQILGQVTKEVAVYVYFNGFTDPSSPVPPRLFPTTRARAW